jgi:acyl carrier protein
MQVNEQNNNIEDDIIKIIADHLGLFPLSLNKIIQIKYFGADDLDIYELLITLEECFNVDFEDYNKINKESNINDVISLVENAITQRLDDK